MSNLEIRQFREMILAISQSSPLPIEVKRLVLSEILSAANKEADNEVNNEIALIKQKTETNSPLEESEEKEHE